MNIQPYTTSYHTDCSICITPFETGESVRILACDHLFHPKCVSVWLNEHDTCPNCRQ